VSEAAPEITTREVDRSTHFLFEHKVFQLDGARFSLTDDETRPAFHVDLGVLVAALGLDTLRTEFGVDPESPDGVLLAIIEKSLRFVKEIRPGDSIPRELLDGTASWSVEPRHRLRATTHLRARVIGSDETTDAEDAALERFMESPDTIERYQCATADIARKIGKDMDAEAVEAQLDSLARELAYIEALREQCGQILAIVPKINQLARVYRNDRGIVNELSRIRTLLLRPIEFFDGIFARLGNRNGDDIAKTLEDFYAHVAFIRDQRDDVHQSMMRWEPILAGWKTIEMARSGATEAKITELYRFTARHYVTQQEWSHA